MKRITVVFAILIVLGAGGFGVYHFAGSEGDDQAADQGSDDAELAANDTHAEGAEGETEEEDGETAVPVNVVDVETGSVSTYITSTANLIPEDEVRVQAEVEGRVTRLEVEEGDYVKRGQLLAALLHDDEQILYHKAELKATNARLAFERGERMFTEKLIAQQEHDKLTMDHRIAQQELAEAEWALDRAEIRAPFDGRLTWRNVTLGQHIRPGDELFTVTSFDPLIARIYLPERDVLELDEDREVSITLKADEKVIFDGRIRQISPVVDTSTGTVKVTIEAMSPPGVVRPGGFVIIDIVRQTRDDTLVLPRKAVIRELQSAHVFVARDDDTAEKRNVELGLEEDEQLEIVSGLERGERIVVAGQGSLKDGAKIKVLVDDDAGDEIQASSLTASIRTAG